MSNLVTETEETPSAYGRQVGAQLRNIRRQQRLSLHAVETATGEEFKASVLGAYERGERALSVSRLQRLAEFYRVPVDQLLPRTDAIDHAAATPADAPTGKVTVDLTKLDAAPEGYREMLRRYLGMIQVERQDFNGHVLTIRGDDLAAISRMLGTSPVELQRQLEELGQHP